MNDIYKVIDDFLPSAYYKDLEAKVLSPEFDWHYISNISQGDRGVHKDLDKSGFSSPIYNDYIGPRSSYYDYVAPSLLCIQTACKGRDILRARFDMTVCTKGYEIVHNPHVDLPGTSNITAVLYIGNSDGDTVIYNETTESLSIDTPNPSLTELVRVSPLANRLVLFKGEHWHTGCTPCSHQRRVLLNSNYLI